MEVDNQILPQSIARYLAKEAKLYGKDNLEQAKTDAVSLKKKTDQIKIIKKIYF